MPRLEAAITGVGVLSSVGLGWSAFSESLRFGVLGLDGWSGDPQLLVGEITGFTVADYLVAEKTYLDRCTELALAAVKLGWDHAGLAERPVPEDRLGLVIGTMYGCAGTMDAYSARLRQRGPRFATPVLFTHSFVNTPASLAAIDFRIRGHHATITSGSGSGALALVAGLTALAAGHAEAIIAGGVEALCAPLMEAWRARVTALDDPDEYDPFTGTVLGEGAAVLVLETPDSAERRGAEVLGWLGLADSLGQAVALAGTPATVLPDGRPCFAPQGLYGDCLGASGALAVAAALAAIQHGCLPPVLGGEEPLPDRREPRSAPELHHVDVHQPVAGGRPITLSVRG